MTVQQYILFIRKYKEKVVETISRQSLIDFYLDYTNKFLTIERMAEHYGMPQEDCSDLISLGKKYHSE